MSYNRSNLVRQGRLAGSECGSAVCAHFIMTKDVTPLEIRVMAYSGYKANERPLTFEVEGRKHTVTNIADRWYGEDADYFKLVADDGRIYIIKWDRFMDRWFLVKMLERLGVH